jgi:hypothetical protein
MTTTPRTIADLDVSVEVLVAAMRQHPDEELAYREAAHLVDHPEAPVSTAVDYPGWVPAHMDPADYARSVEAGFVTPVNWGDCEPVFADRPVADVQTGGAL